MHLREELHHRGPALGVLDCGHEALGLVEDEVAQALGALEQLAVDANVVAGGIGLGAQHGDDFSVHLHAALLDHLLGFAAAGHAGLGQNFLQAFELGGRAGFDFRLGVFFDSAGSVSVAASIAGSDRNRCFAVGLVSDGIYDFGFWAWLRLRVRADSRAAGQSDFFVFFSHGECFSVSACSVGRGAAGLPLVAGFVTGRHPGGHGGLRGFRGSASRESSPLSRLIVAFVQFQAQVQIRFAG